MKNRLWLLIVVLALLLLIGLFSGAASVWAIVVVLALGAVAGSRWLQRQNEDTEVAEELVDPEKAEAAIRSVPLQPAFNVVLEGETAAPAATPGASPEADSVEARIFERRN